MPKTSLLAAITVMCLSPNPTYYRAGVRFQQGKNLFEPGRLSEEQLARIEADPHLKIRAPENSNPQTDQASGLEGAVDDGRGVPELTAKPKTRGKAK